MDTSTAGPRRRTAGLVVRPAGDEVLIYDLERHRAHGLNAVAAAVWQHCDGTRDAAAIAAALPAGGGPPVTVDAVRYALAELGRARGHAAGADATAGRDRRGGGAHRGVHRGAHGRPGPVPVPTGLPVPGPPGKLRASALRRRRRS